MLAVRTSRTLMSVPLLTEISSAADMFLARLFAFKYNVEDILVTQGNARTRVSSSHVDVA